MTISIVDNRKAATHNGTKPAHDHKWRQYLTLESNPDKSKYHIGAAIENQMIQLLLASGLDEIIRNSLTNTEALNLSCVLTKIQEMRILVGPSERPNVALVNKLNKFRFKEDESND